MSSVEQLFLINNNNNNNNGTIIDTATTTIINAFNVATVSDNLFNINNNYFTTTTSAIVNNLYTFDNTNNINNSVIDEINKNVTIDLSNNNNNNSYLENLSLTVGYVKKDYVFDRTDVRIIFITLYSLVFCCCFFGNLLVIIVVILSRRLRSITNFFLANLAVADFCVGVFCVMQNLTIYLIDSWVFGEFLCKMYQFVHSLSYTASIFILVVICMERYFAIIHPITCKQILTPTRLRIVILGVWIASAAYSTPKYLFSQTITNIHTSNGMNEEICILNRKLINSKMLDFVNFVLLYILPLLVMTILYSRIAVALWKSTQGLGRHMQMQNTNSNATSNASPSVGSHHHLTRHPSTNYERRNVGPTDSQVSVESDRVVVTTWRNQSLHRHGATQFSQMSHSSNNVLRARRGVIRMLIFVVLAFALCNLPLHGRKLWQHWSHNYQGDSNFSALFTPLTFLATYFNSGVNPILYAFLSRNFRKGMRELLFCSFKKSKSKAQQRIPLQNHSLPTDTTHIGIQL